MSPKKDAGLTDRQHVELDALAPKCDGDIDTADISEVREFSNPRRGMFAGSPNRRAVPKRETAHRELPDDESGDWPDEEFVNVEAGESDEILEHSARKRYH